MKVKVKWEDISNEMFGRIMGAKKGEFIELEASPIEERPEWEKKLSEWTNAGYNGTDILHFIRQEILTKFAEECKEVCYRNQAASAVGGINAVLKRWMGGNR